MLVEVPGASEALRLRAESNDVSFNVVFLKEFRLKMN